MVFAQKTMVYKLKSNKKCPKAEKHFVHLLMGMMQKRNRLLTKLGKSTED